MTLTLTRIDESIESAASEAVALRRHLRALRGLSDALARAPDMTELGRATQRETARAMAADAFLLCMYDEASQTVEVVQQFDSGVELGGGTFPIGSGLTSQVIRTRQCQLICRWSVEGPPVQVQCASGTPGLPESAVTAPLLFGDLVLGVISAYSYQPEAFDDDDLLALEVIAGQVSIAIANLRHSDRLDSQLSGGYRSRRRSSPLWPMR